MVTPAQRRAGERAARTGSGRSVTTVVVGTGGLAAHIAAANPHPNYATSSDHGVLGGLADDDHSQYHTDTRGDARYSQLGHGHAYDPTGTAASSVAAHEAAGDPHGQYLTPGEGNAAYSAAGHDHAGVYQPAATVLTNTTAAFTTAQETKLGGIATGATANSADAILLSRTNHTDQQAFATLSDGTETVQDIVGAMIAAAGGTYDGGTNTITLPSGGGGLTFRQTLAIAGA